MYINVYMYIWIIQTFKYINILYIYIYINQVWLHFFSWLKMYKDELNKGHFVHIM